MRTAFFVIRMITLISSIIGLQSLAHSQTKAMVTRIGETIPDPASILDIASFAKNKSIARELGLSESCSKELNSLIDKSGGSLSTPVFIWKGGEFEPTPQQLMDASDAQEKENEKLVRELLSKDQLERLRQLVYQIEISRIGLTASMIDGFFGRDIGIEPFEKHALKTISEAIESETDRLTRKILTDSRMEFFAALTSEQQQTAELLVGKAFTFRDELKSFSRSRKIPSPDHVPNLLILLRHYSIANEIHLNEKEREEIRKLSDAKTTRPKNMTQAMTEVLDPHQIDRLKEILYQMEISICGLHGAIVEGHLGKKIGITENQKSELHELAMGIQARADSATAKILETSRAKIFSELQPMQRQRAIAILGKSFVFHE